MESKKLKILFDEKPELDKCFKKIEILPSLVIWPEISKNLDIILNEIIETFQKSNSKEELILAIEDQYKKLKDYEVNTNDYNELIRKGIYMLAAYYLKLEFKLHDEPKIPLYIESLCQYSDEKFEKKYYLQKKHEK